MLWPIKLNYFVSYQKKLTPWRRRMRSSLLTKSRYRASTLTYIKPNVWSYSWEHVAVCLHMFRRLWRSRSCPTERPIRSRSAAWETSWTTKRSSWLSCRSKTDITPPDEFPFLCVTLTDFITDICAAWTSRSCLSRTDWESNTRSSRLLTRRRAASCRSSRNASHLHSWRVSFHMQACILILTPVSCTAGCCRTDVSRPGRTWRDWRRLWSVIFMCI